MLLLLTTPAASDDPRNHLKIVRKLLLITSTTDCILFGAVSMGIDLNLLAQLRETVEKWSVSGRAATLGVQSIVASTDAVERLLPLGGPPVRDQYALFGRLGFASTEAIDASDFEGATHVFDLNSETTPPALCGRYDLVYNGGTLEHVFDLRAALRHLFNILTPGGVVVHVCPVNGWVDHGFYQISPTLLTDYYFANSFDILESRLIEFLSNDSGTSMVHSYQPGCLDALPSGAFGGRWLSYFAARKTAASTWQTIPQQRLYVKLYGPPENVAAVPRLHYFEPYRLREGQRLEEQLRVAPLRNVLRGTGHEWLAHLPEVAHFADDVPGRMSPLRLYEDGRPLGPPHSDRSEIRDWGRGRFVHWGEWVAFSTSDNRPATRTYTYAVPTAL